MQKRVNDDILNNWPITCHHDSRESSSTTWSIPSPHDPIIACSQSHIDFSHAKEQAHMHARTEPQQRQIGLAIW